MQRNPINNENKKVNYFGLFDGVDIVTKSAS